MVAIRVCLVRIALGMGVHTRLGFAGALVCMACNGPRRAEGDQGQHEKGWEGSPGHSGQMQLVVGETLLRSRVGVHRRRPGAKPRPA